MLCLHTMVISSLTLYSHLVILALAATQISRFSTKQPSTRIYMSGGHNFLLLAMDMAKVAGPLSVVKVLIQN
jgi:hypothetical protein